MATFWLRSTDTFMVKLSGLDFYKYGVNTTDWVIFQGAYIWYLLLLIMIVLPGFTMFSESGTMI